MANTIKLKRSSTADAVPTTGQLALGEIAINTNDGKVYIKKNDGSDSVILVGANDLSSFNNDMSKIVTTEPTDGTGYPVGHVWYVI